MEFQNVAYALTGGEQAYESADRNAKAADAGSAPHHAGIVRDPVEQFVRHASSVPQNPAAAMA